MLGKTDPNSMLDPLIECPCTDRVSRVTVNQFSVLTTGTCPHSFTSAQDCYNAVSALVDVSSNQTVDNTSLPFGCIMTPDRNRISYAAIFNSASSSTQVCGDSEELNGPIVGQMSSLIDLSITADGTTDTVTIKMVGPDTVWFGVGFNAGNMGDLPYAIIVDGTGSVSERKLGDHNPGTLLTPSVKIVSNIVSGSNRIVVLTRSMTGNTKDYYSFPTSPATINFINAVGSTPTIAYHKARTVAKITLIPTQVSSCLCAPTQTKYLSYMNSSMTQYNVYCEPEPRGDMAQQHNPACEMETYHGGISCCLHQWFLTDVDQEHLIPADVDTYYLKFRFYFQEYIPSTTTTQASHQHLHHWIFLIDAEINDYEEVKCADGTMCEGSITARLTARNMGLDDVPPNFTGIMPLVIAGHCHAPSCIREELYNANTGDLLCRVTALYGTGSEPHNEAGYVALPPCLFGYQDGLRPPITLSPDTNLVAIKVFNNTYGHLGQMAQWTGLMVYVGDSGDVVEHQGAVQNIVKN